MRQLIVKSYDISGRRSICHQTGAASSNNKHIVYKRINKVLTAEYRNL